MLYSVIDVETTGVYSNDRILEVGIVLMDDSGTTISEFETLINPMRHIENSKFHGVEPRHVADAPKFEDVAGTILDLLQRADVVVAHNFPFDWRMLCNEFRRLGYDLPAEVSSLCTLQTFQSIDPNCPRHLPMLCAIYDIPMEKHHSALGDARCAAALLKMCFEAGLEVTLHGATDWPPHKFAQASKLMARGANSNGSSQHGVLHRLFDGLPSHQDDVNLDAYFQLLDRVFADAILEEEEAQQLVDLANSLGMSREQAQKAHETYFGELVAVAAADGYVSELEREHLNAVSQALGLNASPDLRQLETLKLYPRDLNGKTVCFTGEIRGKVDGKGVCRNRIAELATGFGLTVKSGVSKKLDLLVVEDPYTMSGKAKKAREYRIPIVTEQVFWNWAGVHAT